jgi:hypothetical protein
MLVKLPHQNSNYSVDEVRQAYAKHKLKLLNQCQGYLALSKSFFHNPIIINMRKIIFLQLSFCLLLLSSFDAFSQQANFIQISGTVTKGNIPIPHVKVTLKNAKGDFSQSNTTDNEGFFRFVKLRKDSYIVMAESPRLGERWIKSFPRVVNTNKILIDFDVDTAPGSISGQVTDDDDEKKPIENLKITLVDLLDPESKQDVAVKPDGSYQTGEILQGKYQLLFEAPGYETKDKEVNVKGRGDKKHKKVNVELDKKSK